MKAADRAGAAFILVLGEAERAADEVKVRKMADGREDRVPIAGIGDYLRANR